MRGPPGADEPEIAAAAERVGVTPVAAMPGWGALLDHDQMRRKIHKRSNVSRTESTNEPRQPSRLEKKRNTHAGCPTGHGPTRGVSGVSDSTTLFHMLAQTGLEPRAAVHDRRNREHPAARRPVACSAVAARTIAPDGRDDGQPPVSASPIMPGCRWFRRRRSTRSARRSPPNPRTGRARLRSPPTRPLVPHPRRWRASG